MTQDQSPSPLVFAVTPHASTNFAQEVRQLYVGTALAPSGNDTSSNNAENKG